MYKNLDKKLQQAYDELLNQRKRGGLYPPPLPSDRNNQEQIETLEKLEDSRLEKRKLNELSDENVKSIGSQLDEVNNEIRKLLLKREVLENSLDNFKKEINSKFDKENPSYQPKISKLKTKGRISYSPVTIDLSDYYRRVEQLRKISDIDLDEIDL